MEKELRSIIDSNRYLQYYLDNCVRCGACVEACHFYQGDKNTPLHVPVYKNELVRRLYKQKTLLGRLGLYGSAEGVSSDNIAYAVYQSCTNCRRCVIFCPLSIDISVINTAGRNSLIKTGKAPQMLLDLAGMQIERRLHLEGYIDIFREQLTDIETQVRKDINDNSFRIPLSEKDAKILYVPLSGVHTITPVAKIFHAAHERWTISTFDASNYGYLAGDMGMAKEIMRPIIEEAKKINSDKVVISECGHAYRIMKYFAELWFGKLPFQVELIAETIGKYIRDNRIQLDRSKNPERFTHHDPCQHARNAGLLEEPRNVLKHTVKEFVEMSPNRERNWCCGGGGGVVAVPEYTETRLNGGRMKVKQIKDTDAKVVTTTCDNCKLTLSDLNSHYNLGVRIEGIADITERAIIF